MTSREGISRPAKGSAKVVFKRGLYRDLNAAIRELLANSMTWMYVANTPEDIRNVYLTTNIGDAKDIWCEDNGTGLAPIRYQKFIEMGHESNDEVHNERMQDPNFISQIGIGINSFLALSETEEVEFHSISVDDEGRKTGLIAKMWGIPDDILMDPIPWTGDPKDTGLNHIGMKVIIKNGKDLPRDKVLQYISETFQLKLKEYPVFFRDAHNDLEYIRIKPSADICTKHIQTLFYLSDGTEVRGDIHHVDDIKDVKLRMCVKRVRMEEIDKLENGKVYLARGIINTDSLGIKFLAGRGGFITSKDTLYPELMEKLEQWLIDNEFRQPQPPKADRVKDEKGIMDATTSVLLSLSKSDEYKDLIPQLAGSLNIEGIEGLAQEDPETEIERQGISDWELYAKNQKRTLTGSKPKGKIQRFQVCKWPREEPRKKRPIDEPGDDPNYHGYEDGGNSTVLQPKQNENEEKEKQPEIKQTKVVPRIATLTVTMDSPSPLSRVQYDEENKRIVWAINTCNATGQKLGMVKHTAKNPHLIKMCFSKALVDYIAEKEEFDRERASRMWEYLMSYGGGTQ